MTAAIVHAEEVAVAKDALISTAVSLPRSIGAKYDFTPNGAMQLKPCAIDPIDEMLIDEQFSSRTDLDRLSAASFRFVALSHRQTDREANRCQT